MLVHLAVLSVAVCAAARPAAASPSVSEDGERGSVTRGRFHGLALEGWYGKVGLQSGVVFGRERGTSPLLGGTATFVRMNEHLEWYGLQGDLLIDWNGD